MKKLLSLKKFRKENQGALLEKELLVAINGGYTNSFSYEDRSTLDQWNCNDTERRITYDNGTPCSNWVRVWSETNSPYSY